MAENNPNIISALNLVDSKMRLRAKTSEVIRADKVKYDPNKKQIIGGDTTDFTHDNHPAIIIEKDGDKMSKVIVRCPCGRHSELICDYEDEVGPAVETQIDNPHEAQDNQEEPTNEEEQ